MTAAALVLVTCPCCCGRQEIQTGRDHFGQAITETCTLCAGTGDVTADVLAWWQEQQP